MKKLLVLTMMILLPASIVAEEAKKENIECNSFEREIKKDILELGECWSNSDCVTKSFGCPWDFDICQHHIISLDEKDKNKAIDEKIAKYDEQCLKDSDRCKKYNAILEKTKCNVDLHLLCINGQCVPQIRVLMNGSAGGEDSFGSRAILYDLDKKRE